ncbi:ABC transporter permease [Rhizobium sp. BK068]|uniref:ABC transporter permease n=1 Tax=Rhizobium sp. BK068 TaxID=2512130 RepID=UPI00104F83AA|nr:ABC transporter permease [Rhizobium sp. BK068]TCM74957.1 putative spermidine/putrescine transport system permease protein [Rhizobium sp. BK068]
MVAYMELTTVDGRPLRAALASAQVRARRRAMMLVAPLLLFVVITFIVPIGQVLFRSISNNGFSQTAPHLAAWFEANPSKTPPDEAAFAALAADLDVMRRDRTAGSAGTRLNDVIPGARSLFTSTARSAADIAPPFKDTLVAKDARWEDPRLWHAMRSASSPYSFDYYIIAADRQRDAEGHIVPAPQERRLYVGLFAKTFWQSGFITLLCLVLAFPIAHLIATVRPSTANLLLILVLLPFWTSLLVRTSSWIVLLQGQGVVNDVLVAMGIVDTDHRLALIYNNVGTIIVMTHVLLPFMVLPLYSVMRMINPAYVRAARSLGATSWTAFRRVYLPLTLPGVGAGSLLVFILAVGYYITPALVGGADGQLISNMIQYHLGASNWSLAAALAFILLVGVMILYWIYDRLIGIDKLKLG